MALASIRVRIVDGVWSSRIGTQETLLEGSRLARRSTVRARFVLRVGFFNDRDFVGFTVLGVSIYGMVATMFAGGGGVAATNWKNLVAPGGFLDNWLGDTTSQEVRVSLSGSGVNL